MREFNITGVCISRKHYVVDVSDKMDKIIELIEKEQYFTINRARQYGKTTTLWNIYNCLEDKYLVVKISFEGIGESAFSSENAFVISFINLVSKRLKQNKLDIDSIRKWEEGRNPLNSLEDLSAKITQLVEDSPKEIILMIDEVDKSSNNQLFLHFLGMLRNKYLDREEGIDSTFKSVILAGVYDVKNLKVKIRPEDEKKYNSPWNIAADFNVDMSFNPKEISTMLADYEKDKHTGMDIAALSEEIYKFTSGYPFLVSKICKLIDERLDKNWTIEGVQEAIKILLDEKNTLFDDLIKNIENDKDIFNSVENLILKGKRMIYNPDAYEKELMFGIMAKADDNSLKIHNKIFEIRIYNYLIAKRAKEQGDILTYEYRTNFIIDEKLNMETVLNKFQEIMHDEYRNKDEKFIEREGRLLFLCFLKPIINGKGFYYVESETRMDNRMDIIVTYGEEQHIIELKIWHGESYENDALKQLAEYLKSKRENKGYLISFNFNKNKQYTKEWKKQDGKEIYAIVV